MSFFLIFKNSIVVMRFSDPIKGHHGHTKIVVPLSTLSEKYRLISDFVNFLMRFKPTHSSVVQREEKKTCKYSFSTFVNKQELCQCLSILNIWLYQDGAD